MTDHRGPRPSVAFCAIAGIAIMVVAGLALPSSPYHPAPSSSGAMPATSSTFPTPIRHVIVIFMEDQALPEVLANGPYERYLSEHYAWAENFTGITSDSLANYKYATSGMDSDNPSQPIPIAVTKAGLTWAAYEESMPYPCDRNSTYATTSLPASVVGDPIHHALYDTDHDPFIWYHDVIKNATYCANHVLPLNLTSWNASLEHNDLPSYVFVTPNATDDDHACPPAKCPGAIPHGDAWLRNFIGGFVNSSAFSDSVLFLTYDYNASERVPPGHPASVLFVAVGADVRDGYVSSQAYDAYNLFTTTEWLLGLSETADHVSPTKFPPMTDLFVA